MANLDRILRELADWFAGGRPFQAGQRFATSLTAPDWSAPGDKAAKDGLIVKVTITVERRAPLVDVARYRDELLAELATGARVGQSYRRGWDGDAARPRCDVHTKERGPFGGRGGHRCDHRPTVAIVYSRITGGPDNVAHMTLLACNQHREKHGVDAARVLAVVELMPGALDRAWRAGCDSYVRRREQKIAEARAAGKPVCKRCGVDGSCVVPPCDYETPAAG